MRKIPHDRNQDKAQSIWLNGYQIYKQFHKTIFNLNLTRMGKKLYFLYSSRNRAKKD